MLVFTSQSQAWHGGVKGWDLPPVLLRLETKPVTLYTLTLCEGIARGFAACHAVPGCKHACVTLQCANDEEPWYDLVCTGTSGPDLSRMTSESLGSIYKEMVSQVAIQMVAANSSAAAGADHGCIEFSPHSGLMYTVMTTSSKSAHVVCWLLRMYWPAAFHFQPIHNQVPASVLEWLCNRNTFVHASDVIQCSGVLCG